VQRSVRMSADESWAVLAAAHTGILTTVRRDGMPIALPVWFVVFDRRVFVSGPARSKKFTRVRRDPRVSFLVESGTRWAELRAVHLTGRAAFVDDPTLLETVAVALHEKYGVFRTPREAMPAETRAHYEVRTTTIEIVADERILNWDNARLGLEGE